MYPQPGAQPQQPVPIPDDDLVQATFQQLKKPRSPARPRLLQDTVRQLMQHQGRLSLVTGQSGQGKTAFLVQGPRGLDRRERGLCVLRRAKEVGHRKLAYVTVFSVLFPLRHPLCQPCRLRMGPRWPP